MKTIGILGVTGNNTTAIFFKNLIELAHIENVSDDLRIIVDNNAQIPNYSRAILNNEESPVSRMIDSCKCFSSYPVDFIVIPSNSAAYFIPEIRKKIKIPILDSFCIVAEAFRHKFPDINNAAVLGGPITYLKKTFKASLEKNNIKLFEYDKQIHAKVLDIIEKLKTGMEYNSLTQKYTTIIQNLKNEGAQGIILACTELSIFRTLKVDLPIVDSNSILTDETVQIALGRKVVPLDIEDVYSFWQKRSRMLAEGVVSDYQSTLLTIDPNTAAQRDSLEKEKLFSVANNFKNKFKGIAVEYGCGIGRITEALSNYFDRIDGIDYCVEFIEKAKKNAMEKNISNVNYLVSSIGEYVTDQKYNCAICSGIIEYQNENQFFKLVSTISNNLITSGICLLRESVGVQKRFELHGYFSSVLNSTYDAVYRTSEEIVNEFKKYGCVKIYEEMTIPPTSDKPETCQKILIIEKQ
jgi:aspartate racemase